MLNGVGENIREVIRHNIEFNRLMTCDSRKESALAACLPFFVLCKCWQIPLYDLAHRSDSSFRGTTASVVRFSESRIFPFFWPGNRAGGRIYFDESGKEGNTLKLVFSS